MGFSIGSNIKAQRVARTADRLGSELDRVFERLSSGMRINRASDDAAGLAVASSLNLQRRVYSQGVRNFSDAISAITVADGALEQLGSITMRIRELAAQSANGSFSRTQRLSLQEEASQLRNEFNRIVGSTSFNGIDLLSAAMTSLRVQGGFGTAGGIDLRFNDSLSRDSGTGTMSRFATATSGTGNSDPQLADINGDGLLDMIYTETTNLTYRFGNGDGTFGGASTIAVGASTLGQAIVGDFNGDALVDVMVVDNSGAASVYLLTGTGSGFSGPSLKATFTHSATRLRAGDLNGDGVLDLLAASGGGSAVMLNNSDGTFSASSFAANISGDVDLGDMDNDGDLDFILGGGAGNSFTIHYNNGLGQFLSSMTTNVGHGVQGVTVGDFDADGYFDVATLSSSGAALVNVYSSNQGSSYSLTSTINATTGNGRIRSEDLNGDGVDDIVATNIAGQQAIVLISQVNRTFNQQTVTGFGASTSTLGFGDINNDGALDIMVRTSSNHQVVFGTPESTNQLQYLRLYTQQDARNTLSLMDALLQRVIGERANLGANLSRLESGMNVLRSIGDALHQAQSRITDADIAQETANLVRTKLLQQAAVAILSQANQEPALVLKLLT